MKIRTGRLVEGDVVSRYTIRIWTACSWNLSNNNLTQTLRDKAYQAAGITPGIRYADSIAAYGATSGNKTDKDWCFEIIINRRDWKEVTE